MPACMSRSICVGSSASNRATLKFVGSVTWRTLTGSSGGRKACGSGLHSVMKAGSKLCQTVGSV